VADKSLRVDVEQPAKANLPKRVSYSQMSLYQQCGLKYFFSYIDGWREPPTSALAGGSITHEVVEHLYRLAPEDRTLEAAMELLREHGPRMLKAAEYKPFESDNKMKHSVKETGKSPGKFVDDKLAQPYLYALGFKTQHDIDVDEVELIFLNAQEVVRRPADSGLVISQGEKLAQMRAGSESDVQSSSWEARVSRLCDYCAFERVCPARTPEAPVPGSTECDTKLSEAGLLHK